MSPIERSDIKGAEPAAVSIGERAAVFAFCGWLSGRKQTSGPFGAEFDASELAVLADRFSEPQGWTDPLGVAGLDTLLAVGEVRRLAHLVGDVLPINRLVELGTQPPPIGPHHLLAMATATVGGATPLIANGNPGGYPPGEDPYLPQYKVYPVKQFDASGWASPAAGARPGLGRQGSARTA
jgi:hypothetical protein